MDFNTFIALICMLNFHHFLKAENLDSHQHTLETYIVHVDAQIDDPLSLLPTATTSTSTDHDQRILYRYRNVFSGFAAKLSADEVKILREKNGFVSAQPERVFRLHTTLSPNFLGLNRDMGFWKQSNYGKGVIIGLLDSGIVPDHPSFNDEGMPPPPPKWKGKCEFKSGANCNNKLIGARIFLNNGNVETPLDEDGHGTHTSSTAAGNFVDGVSFLGNANGTATGIAPRAHLSMYRVCGPNDCAESDIIAGMDAAIDDGVDIISISLGGVRSSAFHSDNVAIGAYRAMQKGIFVSCSAGNKGPAGQTVENDAPWILTVGASTIDRKITATAMLGDNKELDGESAFQPRDFPATKLPLVIKFCDRVRGNEYKGKIVVCKPGGASGLTTRDTLGDAVKSGGGAAMILMNTDTNGDTTFAEVDVLPATQLSYENSRKLIDYQSSTLNPTATILFKGTVIGDRRAPVVASFSSRGPSLASPGILKPDIIGPGVNILAAWQNKTDTMTNFNIISGTSMSCPHLSGVAALLKSAHPDWSPAAIKSAIMTTADQVNLGGDPILDSNLHPADVFTIGSGHVNPSKANDPGLIYDIHPDDYIPYLCGLKYTDQEVSKIVQRRVQCSSQSSIPEAQLNYPSFSIKLWATPQTYTRTVTNVGEANSLYNVEIVSPDQVVVNVQPAKLNFSQVGQKLSYNVTFSRSAAGARSDFAQGSIKWISGKYSVRIPIVVAFA